MSESADCDRRDLAAVEDALRTYPLAPVPPGLHLATMGRIRALGAVPRFRLTWLDWALSLLAGLLGALVLFVWWSIPPQAVLEIKLEAILLLDALSLVLPWPGLFTTLVLAASALAAVAALLYLCPNRPASGRYASSRQG